MLVKPYDAALTTNPASVRPPDVAQLTAQTERLIEGLARAAQADNVSLSSAVRGLNSTLSQALPELDPDRIFELLTPNDRFVLVRALELAEHEKLDAKEVQRLLVDLARYRATERLANDGSREQLDTKTTRALLAALPGNGRRGERLALASFSARDEALARRILSSYALRDSAVDPGFVRALVDPDRNPTRAVDFAFLRRLVVALSPSQSEGVDGKVSLGPRVARAQLAEAFARLGLNAADLPSATRETLAQGRTLLKQRIAQLDANAVSGNKGENPLFALLRANDRSLLGMLYLAAAQKRSDLRAVDDVARALIELRTAERAARSGTASLPSLIPVASGESQAPKAQTGAPTADPANASARPRPPSGTYTRASMIPSALPVPLASDAALEAEPGLVLAAELANSDSLMPPAARSFGSTSQLAARAAGSYRSLAPPPPAQPDATALPSAPGLAALAASLAPEHALSTTTSAQQASSLARPLDLSQALGLGALIEHARARKKLPKRLKLPALDRSVHGVSAPRAAPPEAEADDPLLTTTRRERRRVRWQLLIQRRKRRREQHE